MFHNTCAVTIVCHNACAATIMYRNDCVRNLDNRATLLNTTAPLVGATVRLYDGNGMLFASSTTDSNGTVASPGFIRVTKT